MKPIPYPFLWPRRRVPALLALAALGCLAQPARAQVLTLASAADSALATHPAILAAQARVDGAGAARAAARAAYLPTVAGSTGLTRHAEPMVVAPLHGFDPTNPPDFDRTLIQSQVGLDFTLFDGGARRSRVNGAQAMEEGMELRRDATAQDLLEAVSTAYTGVLATRAFLAAATSHTQALSSELERSQQRLEEGTAAQVEVLRAQAALLDAQAQLASAEARVTLAEQGLARLMGVEPGSLQGRDLADLTPRAHATGPDAPTWDPRVQAAQRNVDAAMARLGQERAGRLPSLKATAGLLNFGSGLGDYVTEWQAGVRLSWPLFTGGARSAVIHRAQADLQVAREELRQTELAAAGDLDEAAAKLQEASARARALDASVVQWEEVARIEALALETGAGVQQDFLRAQAALFQARAAQARAHYDELLAHVGRARAQGRLDRAWMDDALESRR